MNNMEINKGEIISDILLIDGYSLFLRFNRIREHINNKLKEQVVNDIYAQVGIDECDRLMVVFYSGNIKTGDIVLVKEGLDDEDSHDKKAKFIEIINIMFNKLIQKKMKKKLKGVAPLATKVECNNCALDVVKIISLYRNENAPIMKKAGFDLSEACNKLTNGVIDSVIVEEGMFNFINDKGMSMTFNSIGYSEEDLMNVVTIYINSMIEVNEILKPHDDSIRVSEVQNDGTAAEHRANSAKVPSARHSKLTAGQKKEYNKLITQVFDSIDFDTEIEKRAFSQQVRGKMLHCAHNVGLKIERGTSTEALVSEMTPDNVERVKALYDLYDQQIPTWFVRLSDKSITKKRAMTV